MRYIYPTLSHDIEARVHSVYLGYAEDPSCLSIFAA